VLESPRDVRHFDGGFCIFAPWTERDPLASPPFLGLTVFLSLALMLAVTGCLSSRIHDCRFYFDHAEYTKAEECCDRLLADSPDNADGLFLKGRLEGLRGDYEAMNRHFNSSLDHSAKHRNRIVYLRELLWTERFNQGVDHFNAGRFADAVPCFGDAVKILPDVQSSRVQLSLSQLLVSGEDAGALAYLRSLPLALLDIRTLNNLAFYYLQHYDYDQVLAVTAEVLAREPGNAPALTRRAPACVMAGQLEEAYDTYQSLLRHAPADEVICRDLARVAFEMGKFREAVGHYHRAIRLHAEQDVPYESYFYLGMCYYEMEDYERMAESFEQLAAAFPEDPAVWRNLVVAYIRLKNPAAEEAARERLEGLEGRGSGGR